ncbi:3'(2'),5'-bisphosphate nucleotidase CysQ [Leptospira idonii]|uniref:3'(2'),5'-bisphosphate nucleotidase CysQ n=1 Tax=Leptospira idonii TaxID=1193500 RepID=A0A4V3JXT6_9LEPT|nr:3'(2'),5'-bisphosphate nucleotidase CysQ [Leptospira idonii]TGN18506.1 3'(2'),5'-bisphosphate nucleotidase CysQ [Leptospira idonii]
MGNEDFVEVWNWVLEAGDQILAIYQTDFAVKDKGGNDPVTEADLLASEFLQKKISERFPKHGFLSEEIRDNSDRLDKEWVWILDPIDGTREFVKKNDQFALSLGLVRNGTPVWGVIFNPATGEFFSKLDSTFFIKLTPPFFTAENLEKILLTSKSVFSHEDIDFGKEHKPILNVSYSEMKEGLFEDSFWKDGFEIKAMGSIAYKLGLLSAGHVDLIVSLKPKNEWDICGGISLLDEENFKYFPLKKDSNYSFNRKDTKSFGLVAGNKKAVGYLEKLVSISTLSERVKDKW